MSRNSGRLFGHANSTRRVLVLVTAVLGDSIVIPAGNGSSADSECHMVAVEHRRVPDFRATPPDEV